MKIKLLGQTGVQIDPKDGTRILFDPYLTDTLHETKGERFARLIPPPEDIAALNPDNMAPAVRTFYNRVLAMYQQEEYVK